MKRFSRLFLLIALLVVAVSCQFTEHIYVEEDGSGRFDFEFDGSGLMDMEGMAPSDSLGDGMADASKDMDSIMDFKQLLIEKRDSIAQLPQEEQEKLKKLERFKMRMRVNEADKLMKFNLFTEFASVAELQDAFATFNDASNINPPRAGQAQVEMSPFGNTANYTKTDYSFNGKVFKRTSTITDLEAYKKATDSLGDAAMFLSSSKYRLNYHFKKPIKKVSYPGAMYSEDRKDVVIEVDFMDYLKNPEMLNLEIELEK